MEIHISENASALGKKAGADAVKLIVEAIREKGFANVILATGTSQFETLKQLIDAEEIDWGKGVILHRVE